MDTLFLHMSPDAGAVAGAWRLGPGGLQTLVGGELPATLAQQHPDSRCVVFLPAGLCLFTAVEVSSKQLRQAGSALSWLIEEQVGEDADNLHVVAGPSADGTATPLLAISRHRLDDILARIPMKRFLEPDEVAAMVTWLCSPECSFTTGAVFDLSGGRATY